jgi:hypothetical protein
MTRKPQGQGKDMEKIWPGDKDWDRTGQERTGKDYDKDWKRAGQEKDSTRTGKGQDREETLTGYKGQKRQYRFRNNSN